MPAATPAATAAGPNPAERGIRDLLGLLGLSALWQGKDGATIVGHMLAAVERLLQTRFAYVEAQLLPEAVPLQRAQVNGRLLAEADCTLWHDSTADWPRTVSVSRPGSAPSPTPLGEMHVVRMEMGMSTLRGGAWFGSDRPDFPTTTELAVLRAATSLAASAIQAARIQYERDQANQAKDEFLAMLGHELRNPLAPIRMGAGLLLRDGISAEQVRKTALIIDRQVGHLTGLVDGLLDMSRLATGAVLLAPASVDLHEVVHDALEQTAPLMASKAHTVTLELTPGAALVFGDRNRLVQVLANLLNNAARYTPAGGRITVTLARRGAHVLVRVSDNGIGIEPAMLRRVFELFAQARRSSDRSEGGLGVGLALARQLVDLHGGTLMAHGEGLGHGAAFELLLPRHVNAVAAMPPPVPAAPPRALQLLIVDDNRDAADTLAEMLRLFNHAVTVCYHPHEALAWAASGHADVCLLDIGLPDLDGHELARRLLALPGTAGATLLALTGYGQAQDRARALAAGFHHHCVKPVSMAQLHAILADHRPLS